VLLAKSNSLPNIDKKRMNTRRQYNNKNKDQQGIGNVHRTPPPDTPKQDTQKAPNKHPDTRARHVI
jgi:hypothetical protein